MSDNVKHSTSYFHEVVAKSFEMFKNGYEPVMETPFQPRRRGSAFVVEYKLVRESLDEVVNFDIDKMDQALKSDRIQVPDELKMEDFDEFMKQCQPLPKELLERMSALIEKGEANRAFEVLAEQAQELDMDYDKQLTIHEKWEIDDQINSEIDTENVEKELAESESCGKLLYTKEALDELYWTDLQEVGRKFGVKQRDRKKLTRMILEAQEKDSGD